MRDIVIIIVIIAIILTGDICTKKYLNETADELTKSLEDLKEKTIIAMKTENRENIKIEIDNIKNKWDKTNEIWSIIAIHQELDNIEQAITKAKSNIDNGEFADALEEIETAIFFVEHVKEREKVAIRNVF